MKNAIIARMANYKALARAWHWCAANPELACITVFLPGYLSFLLALPEVIGPVWASTAPGGACLMRPSGGPITSGFGPRMHPVTGQAASFHGGTDFGVPVGSSIVAAHDGIVESASISGNAGLLVAVAGQGMRTGYFHLSQVNVQVGQRVVRGQHIGLSGGYAPKPQPNPTCPAGPGCDPRSGRSTGPHLHFQFWHNGQLSNAQNYFTGGCDAEPSGQPSVESQDDEAHEFDGGDHASCSAFERLVPEGDRAMATSSSLMTGP